MAEVSMHVKVSVARHIARTLGIRRAAGYLRNNGVSVEAAVYILLQS